MTPPNRAADQEVLTERAGAARASRPPRQPPVAHTQRRYTFVGPTYENLWAQYRHHGDQAYRNDLLLAYEPLVLMVVSQLSDAVRAYWERDDLASFGLIGLISALDRFEASSPIERFPAYASMCIRGAIFDELRRLDWLPRGVRRQVTEYQAAADHLGHQLGRTPDSAEVLDSMGISGSARSDVLSGVRSSQLLHLDHIIEVESPDGSVRLVETLTDEKSGSPEDSVVGSSEIDELRKAVDDLPERQRLVVTLHLFHGFTFEQVGKQLGVTASRACQIESEALKSLRSMLGAVREDLVSSQAS
ncbi:MAG: sigma-70 family RNA polymerase sigma factor [Acidimicrobiales bacterium]